MLYTAFMLDGPSVVRYPRGSGPGTLPAKDMQALPLGKGEVRRQGRKIALLAFGTLLAATLEAGEALDATVVNMRFVKPLDEALLAQLAREHELLVTVEENVVAGGAGSAVAESLTRQGITLPLLHLGLPDSFVEHGDPAGLLSQCGLDKNGIIQAIQRRLTK
jgi:1-deoxy-D-xylulose-5-phosphate synthase